MRIVVIGVAGTWAPTRAPAGRGGTPRCPRSAADRGALPGPSRLALPSRWRGPEAEEAEGTGSGFSGWSRTSW